MTKILTKQRLAGLRKQAEFENVTWGEIMSIFDHADAQDEKIVALEAENERLRKLAWSASDRTIVRCNHCKGIWIQGESESHFPDCLATPKEEPKG